MKPRQLHQLNEFLKRSKGRMTEQKLLVAEKVMSRSATFTGEEVSTSLAGVVSRATVYRTMSLLLKSDLIRQVTFNEKLVFVVAAESDENDREE